MKKKVLTILRIMLKTQKIRHLDEKLSAVIYKRMVRATKTRRIR